MNVLKFHRAGDGKMTCLARALAQFSALELGWKDKLSHLYLSRVLPGQWACNKQGWTEDLSGPRNVGRGGFQPPEGLNARLMASLWPQSPLGAGISPRWSRQALAARYHPRYQPTRSRIVPPSPHAEQEDKDERIGILPENSSFRFHLDALPTGTLGFAFLWKCQNLRLIVGCWVV